MARKLKLLLIAGARPNFMKVAPLIKCIRQHGAEERSNKTSVESESHGDNPPFYRTFLLPSGPKERKSTLLCQ